MTLNSAGPATKPGAQTAGYPSGPNSEFQHGSVNQPPEPAQQPKSFDPYQSTMSASQAKPSQSGYGQGPTGYDRVVAKGASELPSPEDATSQQTYAAQAPQNRIKAFMSPAVKPTH